MAQVPYNQGVPFAEPASTPPQDYQRVEATPASFGGAIAQGEEKLGEGAITATKFYSQIAAQQAVGIFQKQANADLDNFKQLKGQDAMEARHGAMAKLDELEKDGTSSLPNADAQLAFTNSIRFLRSRYEATIGDHYDQQAQVWGVGVHGDAAKVQLQAIEAGEVDGDAAKVQKGIVGLTQERVSQAQLLYGKNLTPDMMTATQNAAIAEATEVRVKALMPTNPAGAAALLDANKDRLPAGAYEQLSRETKGLSEQAQLGHDTSRFWADRGAGGVDATEGTPARLDPATVGRAKQVHDEAVKQGASDDEGWGWAANAVHESAAQAAPPPGDGGISHGMFQLNKDQLARYQATHDGHLPEQDDLATQLAFARKQAAPSLAGVAGPDGYASAISTSFEVPAGGRQEAADRAATARALAGAAPQIVPAAAQVPASAAPSGIQPASLPAQPQQAAPAHAPQSFTQMQAIMDDAYKESERLYPNDLRLQNQFVANIRERVNTSIMLNSKYEAEVAKQKRDGEEAWGTGIMTALRADPRHFDPGMVWSQTGAGAGIDWEKREEMSRVVTYQLSQAGVQDIGKFGPGYSDVLKGIVGDPEAPGAVHSMRDIWSRAGPNGDLSLSGADALSQIFTNVHKNPDEWGVRTVESSMLDYARDQLWKPVEMAGIKDQAGKDIYNSKFVPAFVLGFDKWRDAHTDNPLGYLTKDNIDKMLAPLRRNPTQEANDRMDETGGRVPGQIEAPGAPIPPAPEGLNVGEWRSIMSAPPVAHDGLPYTHAAWGEVLRRMAADPAHVIPWFDQRFGDHGYSGAELVERLKKVEPSSAASSVVSAIARSAAGDENVQFGAPAPETSAPAAASRPAEPPLVPGKGE